MTDRKSVEKKELSKAICDAIELVSKRHRDIPKIEWFQLLANVLKHELHLTRMLVLACRELERVDD